MLMLQRIRLENKNRTKSNKNNKPLDDTVIISFLNF